MKKYIYTLFLIILGQQAFAQCHLDRHNTTWYNAWTSCTASANPNSSRGESHWLQYNLGYVYVLNESKFWNANHPDFLQDGLNEIVIDYSIDGVTWKEWGVFSIPLASGENLYEGVDGPDFDEILAQYVLITAISNHGGACYSLSELKINVGDVTVDVANFSRPVFTLLSPNPATATINIELVNAIASQDDLTFDILDVLGRTVKTVELSGSPSSVYSLAVDDLEAGTYFVQIVDQELREVVRFVKK